ncbi:MAG: DMT family transporter [Pseudomonadota bacterium]
MTPLGAVVATVTIGLALALQPAMNAEVARRIGSGIGGVMFSLSVSVVVIVAWALITRPTIQPAALAAAPWWIWFSGLIGALFLLTGLSATPAIGAAGFFLCLIVGQLTGSAIADHFGMVGLSERPLTWQRMFGIALVAIGALIAVRERG